jgi:GNAT superfamily N-acetyltransferase
MLKIRKGLDSDAEVIFELINELAVYENAPDEVTLSLEEFKNDGWGELPKFRTLVAELNSTVLGFALFYSRYSTWKGTTIFLEDFVVKESFRKNGIGQELFLALKELAKEENAGRLEWQVLDWNTPAINFYKKHGSRLDETWLNAKFTFEDLQA